MTETPTVHRRALRRLAAFSILACAIPETASAASPPELVGTWILQRAACEDGAGNTLYPLGKAARGMLNYDAKGRVNVQIMASGRPKFSGPDGTASEAELRAAVGGFDAYFGTYSAHPRTGALRHRIEGALVPNEVGKTVERSYRIGKGGRELVLIVPGETGKPELRCMAVWRR